MGAIEDDEQADADLEDSDHKEDTDQTDDDIISTSVVSAALSER